MVPCFWPRGAALKVDQAEAGSQDSQHGVLLPASGVAAASKQEAQSSHCQAAVLDLLELVLLQLRLRSLAVA